MFEMENLSLPPRLKKISLKLPQGQIYGIIGPNGAGKTTFLRTLKRIEKPKTGKIFLDGQEIGSLDYKSLSTKIALVPQNPHVTFPFSVREFLQMGRYGIGKPNPPLLDRLLTELDLEKLADTSLLTLSGGEKQRAYLARSLMTEAPILLLDEPMANLDLKHQNHLWSLLFDLKKKGQTILLALHDLRTALAYTDALILLDQGELVSYGAINEEILFRVFGIRSMECHPF